MTAPKAISPGDRVLVTDADGAEHEMVALSAVEGTHRDGRRIHDFPVVWVEVPGSGGRVPWPASDVRPAGAGQ